MSRNGKSQYLIYIARLRNVIIMFMLSDTGETSSEENFHIWES